jgi:hypothetical protein
MKAILGMQAVSVLMATNTIDDYYLVRFCKVADSD